MRHWTARIGVVIIAVALLAVAVPAPAARAQLDLTGDWNILFDGIGGQQQFNAQVTQTGTSLTIDLGFGDAQLSGAIDKSSGNFTVTGCPDDCQVLTMTGTASQSAMSGTYSSGIGDFGTFSGTRKGAVGGVTLLPDAPGATGSGAPQKAPIIVLLATGGIAGIAAAGWWAKRRVRAR